MGIGGGAPSIGRPGRGGGSRAGPGSRGARRCPPRLPRLQYPRVRHAQVPHRHRLGQLGAGPAGRPGARDHHERRDRKRGARVPLGLHRPRRPRRPGRPAHPDEPGDRRPGRARRGPHLDLGHRPGPIFRAGGHLDALLHRPAGLGGPHGPAGHIRPGGRPVGLLDLRSRGQRQLQWRNVEDEPTDVGVGGSAQDDDHVEDGVRRWRLVP